MKESEVEVKEREKMPNSTTARAEKHHEEGRGKVVDALNVSAGGMAYGPHVENSLQTLSVGAQPNPPNATAVDATT